MTDSTTALLFLLYFGTKAFRHYLEWRSSEARLRHLVRELAHRDEGRP